MMRGYSGTSKQGRSYYYYACNGMIKKICKKKIVRKNDIEDFVISECRKHLTDENISKIAKEVTYICEKEKDNSDLVRLNKLLKNNKRKSKNLTEAILECDFEDMRKDLYKQKPILEQERIDIEKQIALEKASQVYVTIPQIKFFLSQLKNGSIDDIKYRRTLINVFINSIFLYDNKQIVLIFNTSNTPLNINKNLLDDIETKNKFESST